MSWGALPGWVYDVNYQKHESMMLGAFPEELRAGFVRSLPAHVVEIIQRERNQEKDCTEYRTCAIIQVTKQPLPRYNWRCEC